MAKDLSLDMNGSCRLAQASLRTYGKRLPEGSLVFEYPFKSYVKTIFSMIKSNCFKHYNIQMKLNYVK